MAYTARNPKASLDDFNRVAGKVQTFVPASQSLRTNVTGLNPIKITCDELLVRNILSLRGRIATQLELTNGTKNDTALRFGYGGVNSGFYSPSKDHICISIAGTPTACFTPTGLSVPRIYGPSGIIDFGGSTLTNVGAIMTNPGAYTLVGNPVTTAPTATTNALTIPLVAGTTRRAWELLVKVIYLENALGSDPAINGVYTFHVRAYMSITTPPITGLTVTPQYDVTKYHKPAFVGTSVAAVPVAGGVEIRVTSNATMTINWQAKCDVMMVTSP